MALSNSCKRLSLLLLIFACSCQSSACTDVNIAQANKLWAEGQAELDRAKAYKDYQEKMGDADATTRLIIADRISGGLNALLYSASFAIVVLTIRIILRKRPTYPTIVIREVKGE